MWGPSLCETTGRTYRVPMLRLPPAATSPTVLHVPVRTDRLGGSVGAGGSGGSGGSGGGGGGHCGARCAHSTAGHSQS